MMIQRNKIVAIILAAGIGSRLAGNKPNQPPKCLLKFEGKTLLQRHIEALKENGIQSITIVVGYKSTDIFSEIKEIGANNFVSLIENEKYREGSIVSLWCARKILRSQSAVFFMDADVLFHTHLVKVLTEQTETSLLPFDKNFEPGDEPVKVCFKGKKLVDFGKNIDVQYDEIGEWPGFIMLSPKSAEQLADKIDDMIGQGDSNLACETAIRDILLTPSVNEFGFRDITGIPWIEIDFITDVEKAQSITLPAINKFVE